MGKERSTWKDGSTVARDFGVTEDRSPYALEGSVGMDQLRQLVLMVKEQGLAQGKFLGFLHLLIGRRLSLKSGEVVSEGMTWRELASLLKKVRWEKDSVRELGLTPSELPPRDRERYWYRAIVQARLDSSEAISAGDGLSQLLEKLDYVVGPSPTDTSDS